MIGLKEKIIGIVAGLIFGSASIMVFVMVYFAWFDVRDPPITFVYSHPTVVEDGARSRAEIKEVLSIKAGEAIHTYREFCVDHAFVTIETSRHFVKWTDRTEVYQMPLAPSKADSIVGCVARTFTSAVPMGVPPGKYLFHSETVYKLNGNPIGVYVYVWPDVAVAVVQ
jgi:hypothetical protein